MIKETVDTAIIGGGLSGIYAAYLLSQRKTSFVILEARNRIGGRILSLDHQVFFPTLDRPGTGRTFTQEWRS